MSHLTKKALEALAVSVSQYASATEATVKAYADNFEALLQNMQGTPGPPGPTISVPPQGFYKVTNLYVDSNGKLVVDYDDTPTP